MGRKAKELTARAVESLKKNGDGLYAVGGVSGLYLHIGGESQSWILRANVEGKRRDIGLGSFPKIQLSDAREKAGELHKQIRSGVNPIDERKAAQARAASEAAKKKTFRECAEMFIEAKRVEWARKHALRYANSLVIHAYPIIGGVPIADIEIEHVLEVLQQPVKTKGGVRSFWEANTDTASRVRNRIECVLQYAKALKFRTGDNPAEWAILKNTLPSKSKISKSGHYPALPFTEIGAFMADLRKCEGVAARCLEFSILTAARSGEARGALWNEIDLAARVWTIPPERAEGGGGMKMGIEHRVPLSDSAVKLLEALPRYAGNDLVFPASMGGVMSDMAILMTMRRMHDAKKEVDGVGWIDPNQGGSRITAHGFRSTFKDWSEETTGHSSKAVEFALAHKLPDKVEGSYQRMTLFDKRVLLMRDWSHYCDTVQAVRTSNVIPMRKAVSF